MVSTIDLKFADEYKPFNEEENQLIQAKKEQLLLYRPTPKSLKTNMGFFPTSVFWTSFSTTVQEQYLPRKRILVPSKAGENRVMI